MDIITMHYVYLQSESTEEHIYNSNNCYYVAKMVLTKRPET